MAQMKKQVKPPGKGINEMEMSNLSDALFTTLVIRVLQELTGCCDGMKKTRAEMKVALSEVQKNLQGTSCAGEEAKNQINHREHKAGKSIQSEQQEEK